MVGENSGGGKIEVIQPAERSRGAGGSGKLFDENWRKSSFSQNGDCIEVAPLATGRHVQVRDSKKTEGPHLCFSSGAWSAFLEGIRTL
jgi:hypothetical protein